MKVGDLITYEGWKNPRDGASAPTGVALKVYKYKQKYKQVKPFWRELVDVLWEGGEIVTHDTYEMEVISESW